jgi:hypothetical protein
MAPALSLPASRSGDLGLATSTSEISVQPVDTIVTRPATASVCMTVSGIGLADARS